MKSTSARLLAKFSLALAATITVALPLLVAGEASAQPVISAEDRCRTDLAVASRRYMERVLFARLRCQSRIILGVVPPTTTCLSGRGDEKLDKRLRKAEDSLSNVSAACSGVNLQLLGFPGICPDTTGAPFDTSDYAKCTLTKTDEIIARLFNYYYPPLSDFFRGAKATCLKGSPIDAATSFRRIIRAIENCLLGQQNGFIGANVDCRAEIQPYGPGTGDAKVDISLSHAYIELLGAIPDACVDVQINDLNYQSSCPDATGGLFTIFDLKQCFFGTNRAESLAFLLITFPTDPVCGNAVVETGEDCDLGIAGNSNTKPNTCRTNCKNPVCHDGVTDTSFNEECDDGNTVDKDGCSGACVLDKCSDGVINVSGGIQEQCDNGANNSNVVKDACRTNCKIAHCGDGVTDTIDSCDDGNLVDGDGCSSLCIVEFCGDDQIQAGLGEQCDNGVDNANAPDKCRATGPNACKLPKCGDSITDTGEDCDDGNVNNNDACPNDCTICGNGIKSPDEQCDTNGAVCPAGEGCNPSCTCAAACPGVGQLVLYAGVGAECGTNADCPVGTCTDGKCHTTTRLDSGWTGLAHDADINDGIVTRGFLDCPGHGPTCGQCNVIGVDPSIRECRCANDTRKICDQPFVADANDCGGSVCDCYFGAPFPLSSGGTPACVVNRFSENITGTANVDQGAGQIVAKLKTRVYLGILTTNPCPTCGGTCSNNAANTCNQNQDCNGGTCNLDPVADDGVRGGVCINGVNNGQTCDMTGVNTSFPAYPGGVGGGGYSLDCMPDVGKNISGSGLIINLTQTTGTASLASNVSCGGLNPEQNCPCLQCTGDDTVACNSDADCSSQQGSCSASTTTRCTSNTDCASADVGPCVLVNGTTFKCQKQFSKSCAKDGDPLTADPTKCLNTNVGTCNLSICASDKGAGFPSPNACDEGLCSDQGGGIGACTVGPDETSCDGVVKANGTGILACSTNDDCTPSAVGIDAGNCTLVARRPCFLDPITSTGTPDPETPIGVSAFCVPPTSNTGINSVAGLPGPGRIINQATAQTFCEKSTGVSCSTNTDCSAGVCQKSDGKCHKQYIPGAGGCLLP